MAKSNRNNAIDTAFPDAIKLSKNKRDSLKTELHNNPSINENEKQNGGSNPTINQSKAQVVDLMVTLFEKSNDYFNQLGQDALRALDSYLNNKKRKGPAGENSPSIKQLGDVSKAMAATADTVKFINDSLIKLPNVMRQVQYFSQDLIDEIEFLKSGVKKSQESGSLPDVYRMIMTLRGSLIRLTSTVSMLETDPGLLDDLNFINSTRWDKNTDKYGVQRDNYKDNSLQPDITLVKDIFLLMVDDELINELRDRKVSNQVIAALGNYSIPSYKHTGELGYTDLKTKGGDTPNPVTKFEWSRNGSAHNLKTVKAYRKINASFLAEVDEKFESADRQVITEYNMDIAVVHTLSHWLNAAFKVLVESNMHPMKEILKGVEFEKERLLGIDNNVFMMKYLMETFGDDGTAAPLRAVYAALKSTLESNLQSKLPYSETAYKYLSREFRTLTFSIASPENKYYIGPVELGEHRIKVNILPKLFLPTDITTKFPLDVKLTNGTVARYPDMFNMIIDLDRAFYVKDRDTSYNSIIMVSSVMHLLINLKAVDYNKLIDEFMNNNYYLSNNKARVPFSSVFKSAFTERRELSGVPPHYYKNMLLNKIPTYFNENLAEQSRERWYWAYLDMANFKDTVKNDGGVLEGNVPYLFGDLLRSYFNFHADFSWIEMGIAYSTLILNNIKCVRPKNTANGNITFTAANKTAAITVDSFAATTGNIAGDYVVEFTTMIRQHNWSIRYSIKEKIGKSVSLEGFDDISTKAGKPTLIGQEDLSDAYRYVPLKIGSTTYLVDNKFNLRSTQKLFVGTAAHDTLAATILDGFYKVVGQEKESVITEDQLVNTVLNEDYLDKHFLLHDERPSGDKFNYTPVLIPSTDLIGYDLTGSPLLNPSGKTDVPYLISLNLNKFIHIHDNFVPVFMNYTLTTPTNSVRNPLRVQNMKPALIAGHLLSSTGVIDGNGADALKLVAASFGISGEENGIFKPYNGKKTGSKPNQSFYYDDSMKVDYLIENFGYEVNKDHELLPNPKKVTYLDANFEVTNRGWVSAVRYPGQLILNGITLQDRDITGNPELTSNDARISLLKSQAFYSRLKSIVPSPTGARVTDLRTGKHDLVAMVDSVEGDTYRWNSRIVIRPLEILRKLDMEDKRHVRATV